MILALQYTLKSGILILPVLLFFLKTVLTIQGLLCLHTNFKIICSSSVKNIIGNLIRNALNLQTALGSIVILTILILATHVHGIFFHRLMSSQISFISILSFLKYRSFVSLCRFIPRYFVLFVANVNLFLDFLFLILHCKCIEMQQIYVC